MPTGRPGIGLVAWMRELSLEVRVDAMGNIFGVLPAADGESICLRS